MDGWFGDWMEEWLMDDWKNNKRKWMARRMDGWRWIEKEWMNGWKDR